VAKQKIRVSLHAVEKMGIRKIWHDEALEAIISGDEIET
jgi:hypothetical protein